MTMTKNKQKFAVKFNTAGDLMELFVMIHVQIRFVSNFSSNIKIKRETNETGVAIKSEYRATNWI